MGESAQKRVFLLVQSGVFYFLVSSLKKNKEEKENNELGVGKEVTGEGNGTPLQYSCLENPMDRGAW